MKSHFSFIKQFFLVLIIGASLSSCFLKRKTLEIKEQESTKIQSKYAALLNVKENQISSLPLYTFIDEWYKVPYKYSGKSKEGVDCSGFACILYKEIYNKNLNSSSEELYEQCQTISRDSLKEGDLIFFKIESNHVSHVGVYLQNNKFIHATTKAGVIINDLEEPYYKKYYFSSGRLKSN